MKAGLINRSINFSKRTPSYHLAIATMLHSGYNSANSPVRVTDMTNQSQFAHRRNSDGTIDSICRECYVTVASEPDECDLSAKELLHSCNPELVDWYQRSAEGRIPHRSFLA